MNNFEVRIFSPENLNEKWYVYIYHNSKIIKKIYKGINSEGSFEERMIKAEALKSIVEKEIKEGWNPNTKKKTSVMTLFDAIDFGLEKKKSNLAAGSYGEYAIAVNLFKDYGSKEGLKNLAVIHCDRSHIKSVLGSARIDRNWSAMNYNKTLRRLSAIFSELIEWEIISNNPTRDIRPLKEEKTGGYRVMTNKEQKMVFSHLKQYNINYYIFCSIIYYMGIRISELLKVKCEDVSLEKGIIIIRSTDSKNKKIRIVPIIGTLSELLKTFDLSKDENYLFGVPIPGKLPSLKVNYFSPNKYQIKRAYPTNIWKEQIILGLGIDAKLYSNKHKGGRDKLMAGIDIDTISNIFGHSKVKMTELYADYIKDLRFEKAKNVNLDEY